MNSIDNSTRIKIFRNSAHKQRYFFTSQTTGDFIKSANNKYLTATTDPDNNLIVIVGDIILGFYKIEDTVPLLQQELELDPKTAALLGAEVIDFLAPLSDPTWMPPLEVIDETELEEAGEVAKNDTTSAAVASRPVNPAPVVIPVSEPSQLAELAAPAVLHTFAGDLATVRHDPPPSYQPSPALTEPTYSSSQPVVRSSLSSIPNYAPLSEPAIKPVSEQVLPDRPKWSSEG